MGPPHRTWPWYGSSARSTLIQHQHRLPKTLETLPLAPHTDHYTVQDESDTEQHMDSGTGDADEYEFI